jgi:integrase/recombinase XerD
MSIRRRGNRLVIDYYPQGRQGPRKRLTLPENIQDENEAKSIEADLKRARDPEPIQVPSGATVADLFPLYLDWYKLHRKPTSFDALEWVWEHHIKSILGHEVAEVINPQHLANYTRIRKAAKMSNRTVNKELSCISGFLTWSAHKDRHYIQPRQFKPDFLPYKRPIPMVLTFAETARIVAAASPMHRAFFLCLFTLGLRFAEARFLKWEDIDFENAMLRTLQKGGRWKIKPMSKWLIASLKKLRPRKSGYIFLSKKGKPITDVRKAIKRACTAAKVNKHVTPHLFRHSIATYGLGKDVNLRVIQDFMGHGSVDVTEFYTHVQTEHMNKMRDHIDADMAMLHAPVTTKKKK